MGHLHNGMKPMKKKISPFVTAWMELENVILHEVNQSEKDKHHMISLICGL